METSATHYTLQVGLTDRFGDNGMICVIICQRNAEAWDIDSWLMSCRVLNRKVEESVCNRIARDALAAGATRLMGRYIPTDAQRAWWLTCTRGWASSAWPTTATNSAGVWT